MTHQISNANSEEYLKHHPYAIADPVKAEYMAYGTKELEVAANELGRQALQVAMDEADSFLSLVVQGHDETAKNVSSMKLRIQAKTMREKADDSARKIGEAYDVYQYARGHRHFPPK